MEPVDWSYMRTYISTCTPTVPGKQHVGLKVQIIGGKFELDSRFLPDSEHALSENCENWTSEIKMVSPLTLLVCICICKPTY